MAVTERTTNLHQFPKRNLITYSNFQQTVAMNYTQCACNDAFYLIVCGVLQTRGLMMTGTVIHRHVMLCNQLVALYLLTRKTQDCSFKETFFPPKCSSRKQPSFIHRHCLPHHKKITRSHTTGLKVKRRVVFIRKTKVLGCRRMTDTMKKHQVLCMFLFAWINKLSLCVCTWVTLHHTSSDDLRRRTKQGPILGGERTCRRHDRTHKSRAHGGQRRG